MKNVALFIVALLLSGCAHHRKAVKPLPPCPFVNEMYCIGLCQYGGDQFNEWCPKKGRSK